MSELIRSITKREWKFVLILTVGVILITAIPYIYGWATTPPDMTYSGISYLTPGDTNVYLSMIEQVKQGNAIFLNPYTSEPQHKLYINPFWLAVGILGKLLHTSNLLTFHVARSLLVIGFTVVLYLFISYLTREVKKRKWFLAIVLFASGLGVFVGPLMFNVTKLYEWPTDTWVPESVTFLSLLHSPHQTASAALIIFIFLLMLLAFDSNRTIYSFIAGICCLFLLSFHPFNGPTVFGVLAVYMIIIFWRDLKIHWHYVRHYIILGVMAVPAALYFYLINKADWTIQQWNAQNILPSPSAWMYMVGYGFIFLLAILGLWISLKNGQNKDIFVVSWAACSSLLLYIPLYFQRRLSEGLHIPLAILAGGAIFYLMGKFGKNNSGIPYKQMLFGIFLIIFLPLTNIQIVGQDIYYYAKVKDLPYYIYNEELSGMRWLKEHTASGSAIFSSYLMGNFIPAYSGRTVWIGQSPQTANLKQKMTLSDWFWRDDSEVNKKYHFLKENGVGYIFFSRTEKDMGTYNPATKPYLENVFSNSKVSIYKVL